MELFAISAVSSVIVVSCAAPAPPATEFRSLSRVDDLAPGRSRAWCGRTTGLVGRDPATAYARLESGQANAQMGHHVAGAGDVDGAGRSDDHVVDALHIDSSNEDIYFSLVRGSVTLGTIRRGIDREEVESGLARRFSIDIVSPSLLEAGGGIHVPLDQPRAADLYPVVPMAHFTRGDRRQRAAAAKATQAQLHERRRAGRAVDHPNAGRPEIAPEAVRPVRSLEALAVVARAILALGQLLLYLRQPRVGRAGDGGTPLPYRVRRIASLGGNAAGDTDADPYQGSGKETPMNRPGTATASAQPRIRSRQPRLWEMRRHSIRRQHGDREFSPSTTDQFVLRTRRALALIREKIQQA